MTRIDARTPVVVAGMHHGGLAVARTLGRWGVRLHGVDADPAAPGLRSRYLRSAAAWSLREAGPAATVEFLLRMAPAREAILVPTTDELALLVAEHQDTLGERYRFPRVPAAMVRRMSDKRELYLLCRETGIPTPETVLPACRGEVEAFAENAVFPVMLKGIDGARLQARTGVRMAIAGTPAELVALFTRLADPAAPDVVLQEFVPGGDDTVWMFNGYFDAESRCRAGMTGKKLRQHPVHVGSTSLGICLDNPEVTRLTEHFARETGYRGILDIGWRYDARDGGYKLLDPNPRIGSTFRLFVDRPGMDVARWMYLDLTGQPLPERGEYQGRKWMVEDRDLESTLDYMREGTLTAAGWARSLSGVQEAAWFARDDLRPFAAMGAGLAGRAARALGRRLRPGRDLPRVTAPPANEPSTI